MSGDSRMGRVARGLGRGAWVLALVACGAQSASPAAREPDAASIEESRDPGVGTGATIGDAGGRNAPSDASLGARPDGASPSAAPDGSRDAGVQAADAAHGERPGADAGASERWTCPAGPFAALGDSLRATRVEGVAPADDYVASAGVLEGPVWLRGALYVSHFPFDGTQPGRILRVTQPAEVSVFSARAGANGLAVGPEGRLLAARHADGSISVFDLADPERPTPLVRTFEGARFNSPNDLAVRRDGTIYFSDPSYQAPSPAPQPATRLYRVSPDGEVSAADDTLSQPNGVTLSLDETTLFVADTGNVYRYAVSSDGALSDRAVFVPGSSDGMGMDCAGNLYVTRDRSVLVFDPEGTQVSRIEVDSAGNTTNVAFGGRERRTLYITTLGDEQQLFQLALPLPGLPY